MEPISSAMPYTIGRWQQTKPIEMALVKGQNVLEFLRNNEYGESKRRAMGKNVRTGNVVPGYRLRVRIPRPLLTEV